MLATAQINACSSSAAAFALCPRAPPPEAGPQRSSEELFFASAQLLSCSAPLLRLRCRFLRDGSCARVLFLSALARWAFRRRRVVSYCSSLAIPLAVMMQVGGSCQPCLFWPSLLGKNNGTLHKLITTAETSEGLHHRSQQCLLPKNLGPVLFSLAAAMLLGPCRRS